VLQLRVDDLSGGGVPVQITLASVGNFALGDLKGR
jgi:hypothetical protein